MGNELTAAALNAATGMACVAIAVFFARFWSESRDRLYLALGLGFVLLAANYALLALLSAADERRPYVFVLRLIALITILAGVLVKDNEYFDPLGRDDDDSTRRVA